jgi:hypothetical protein
MRARARRLRFKPVILFKPDHEAGEVCAWPGGGAISTMLVPIFCLNISCPQHAWSKTDIRRSRVLKELPDDIWMCGDILQDDRLLKCLHLVDHAAFEASHRRFWWASRSFL